MITLAKKKKQEKRSGGKHRIPHLRRSAETSSTQHPPSKASREASKHCHHHPTSHPGTDDRGGLSYRVLRSQAVHLGRSSRERGTGTGQCEERQVEKEKTTAGKIIYLYSRPATQEEQGQAEAARGSRRGTNRPKLETRLGEVRRTRGPGKPPLSTGTGTGTRRTGEAVDWSVVEHQASARARRCTAC